MVAFHKITRFIEACEKGDMRAVQHYCAFIDPRINNAAPLYEAVCFGRHEVVDFLMSNHCFDAHHVRVLQGALYSGCSKTIDAVMRHIPTSSQHVFHVVMIHALGHISYERDIDLLIDFCAWEHLQSIEHCPFTMRDGAYDYFQQKMQALYDKQQLNKHLGGMDVFKDSNKRKL